MPNETPYEDDRLTAYLDDQMDVEQRARFESELATNAQLRTVVAELRSLGSAIAELPLEKAPADLASHVLRKIEAEHNGSTLPVPADRNPGRRRGLFWASCAVAAAVAIMVWGPGEQQVAIGPAPAPAITPTLGPTLGPTDPPPERRDTEADDDASAVPSDDQYTGGKQRASDVTDEDRSAFELEDAGAGGVLEIPATAQGPIQDASPSLPRHAEQEGLQMGPNVAEVEGVEQLVDDAAAARGANGAVFAQAIETQTPREESADAMRKERQGSTSFSAPAAAPTRTSSPRDSLELRPAEQVEFAEADGDATDDVAPDSDLALDEIPISEPGASTGGWPVYGADIDAEQYAALRTQFDQTRRPYDDRALSVSVESKATVDATTKDRSRPTEKTGMPTRQQPTLEVAPQLLRTLWGNALPSSSSSSLRLLTIEGNLDELRLVFEAANVHIDRLNASTADEVRSFIQSLQRDEVTAARVAASPTAASTERVVERRATIVLILRIADRNARPLADEQP